LGSTSRRDSGGTPRVGDGALTSYSDPDAGRAAKMDFDRFFLEGV
jgi:hypothetical protein